MIFASKTFLATGTLALYMAPQVYAWGAIGHEAVGYIAMAFLNPTALKFVQSSLGSTYNKSLGPAGPWADTIKYTKGYTWSAPLHFVDAEDNPPTSCSVSETRDCSNGRCVLTAIANYTTRLVDASLFTSQTQEALKFLDHFIGDLHQPLHVEAFEVGGNAIAATCDGSTKWNLHSVWDSGIINKMLAANYNGSVATFSSSMVTKIKTGSFNNVAASWIECSDPTEPLGKRSLYSEVRRFVDSRATIKPLECPLEWAQDTNAKNCDFVFTYDGYTDLCNSAYYTEAVPIIQEQLAKAGYRLAVWLNALLG